MGFLIAKHIKKEIIEETVKTLNDEQKLMEIIKNDDNLFGIRELATKQITNNDLLKEIVFDTSDTVYAKGELFDIREIAVGQITDDETLFEIVNKYYDDAITTKYGLNIVERAVSRINNDEMLINISESNYDEEIIKLAIDGINNKFEDHDKTQLTIACDDDSKVKRMWAIDQIEDDEILIEIAMNGKYLDVREKALSKIKIEDERIPLLESLILKEKEYNESVNEYVTLDEDNEENKEDIVNKASKLGVEYKRIGNSKKEKFYNEQCTLFKDK